mgnify:CR=1 FL=1
MILTREHTILNGKDIKNRSLRKEKLFLDLINIGLICLIVVDLKIVDVPHMIDIVEIFMIDHDHGDPGLKDGGLIAFSGNQNLNGSIGVNLLNIKDVIHGVVGAANDSEAVDEGDGLKIRAVPQFGQRIGEDGLIEDGV